MKSLCFLLFLVVVQGFVVEPRKNREELAAPFITRLVTFDNSFKVTWNKVVNPQNSDPVLGYIVKAWQRPDKIVHRFKIIDGKAVLVEGPKDCAMDLNVMPVETPTEFKVVGGDTTQVMIGGIETKSQYYIRVQAYTQDQRGPLSEAVSVKLD